MSNQSILLFEFQATMRTLEFPLFGMDVAFMLPQFAAILVVTPTNITLVTCIAVVGLIVGTQVLLVLELFITNLTLQGSLQIVKVHSQNFLHVLCVRLPTVMHGQEVEHLILLLTFFTGEVVTAAFLTQHNAGVHRFTAHDFPLAVNTRRFYVFRFSLLSMRLPMLLILPRLRKHLLTFPTHKPLLVVFLLVIQKLRLRFKVLVTQDTDVAHPDLQPVFPL